MDNLDVWTPFTYINIYILFNLLLLRMPMQLESADE